jgi:ubiquinone/menaquinone biosynthesis C-methylase UbiE
LSDARGQDDDHEIARSKRDGINLRAGEVAEQSRRGAAQRDQFNAPANEMMLDLANLRAGNRVLDVAAGTGDQTLMAARRVGPTGYVLATDLSTTWLPRKCEMSVSPTLTHGSAGKSPLPF